MASRVLIPTFLIGTGLTESIHAQWINQPKAGVPRIRDGKPNLSAPAPKTANGHPDLTGLWQTDMAAPGEIERIAPGNGILAEPGDDPTTFIRYLHDVMADYKTGDVKLTPAAEKLSQNQAPSAANVCLPAGVPMADLFPIATQLDTGRNEGEHGYPQFLPDGNRFLYLILSADTNVQGIYVGSLDNSKQRVRIVATDRKASYVPAPTGSSGYLLWMREQTLLAQPFDAGKLSLEGSAAPIAEEVASNPGTLRTAFWTSAAGVLTYRTGSSSRTSTLTWFDRQGKAIGTVGNPQGYGELALSPDGTQVAVFRRDSIGDDLWIIEFARGSSSRLTTDPGNESYPVWSPDGKQIAFGAGRAANNNNVFDLYKKPAGASGEKELLLKDDPRKYPTDWSRDGRFLLYSSQPNGAKNWDLRVLPMAGDRKPAKYLATGFNEFGGRFSPDGRWVAYVSDVSKRNEVYVSPFPDASSSPAVLVSTDGGTLPHWRRDRKGFGSSWDVSTDAQRFLVNTASERQSAAPLTVLTNWQARLKHSAESLLQMRFL